MARRLLCASGTIPCQLVTLLTATGLLYGCGNADRTATIDRPSEAAVASRNVQLVHTTAGPITRYVDLPAEVQADQQVLLHAKVSGYLERLAADEGDAVKRGAVLARIEMPELESARSRQQAELRTAEAEFRRLEQGIARAPDLVVPQMLDEARGRYEIAKARVAESETMLRYATIVAPFDGIVTQRRLDAGALVQAGTPLYELMDFRSVRVQIAVPEREAGRVAVGQSVRLGGPNLPGEGIVAQITRFRYALDPRTRTMLAEVRTANPSLRLRPGMILTAQLGIETRDSPKLLPASAVGSERTGAFVFVLADGTARKQPVRTGINDGRQVEILDGLGDGVPVLLADGGPLTPGASVTVRTGD